MQRIPHSMQGHTEVVLGNKENQQGLLETGLLWQEDGVVPGSRGRMWLACWILPPPAGRWNLSGWGLGGLQLFWLRATSWVGAFPAGWGAYLERTEELMVRTMGPCEPQRCQGSSTWNFSPYATSFWASCWLKHLNFDHICCGSTIAPSNPCGWPCIRVAIFAIAHPLLILSEAMWGAWVNVCLVSWTMRKVAGRENREEASGWIQMNFSLEWAAVPAAWIRTHSPSIREAMASPFQGPKKRTRGPMSTKTEEAAAQSFGYKSPFIPIKQSCKHNANFIIGTTGWLTCLGESLRRTLLLCLICDFTAVEDRGRQSDWFSQH